MSFSPFLTAVDRRAQVKGSRDPLGMQSIWVRVGRHCIGNLTTVSTSVTEFTSLLLGLHFAEQVMEQDRSASWLEAFLRWEQLAAYARGDAANDFDFRGTERVRARLAKGRTVTVSAEPAHQILADQKTYGIWGLYSVPARTSGLITGEPPRLTEAAREVVEAEYLPLLTEAAGKGARRVTELLVTRKVTLDLAGRERPLAKAIASLHGIKLGQAARALFRSKLAFGGPDDKTGGLQRQLAELLAASPQQRDTDWSPQLLRDLAKRARKQGASFGNLADRLDRIATYEAVLAPASDLFLHLLGCHGQATSAVVSRVRSAWGPRVKTVEPAAFAALSGDLLEVDRPQAERYQGIAEAMAAGDYQALLDRLLGLNQAITVSRGGAPWVDQSGGKLAVRLQSETGPLPSKDELPTLWRNTYFLDSLRAVVWAIDGVRA